jgi:hypothetical protein
MSNIQTQVRELYATVQKQKSEIASAEKGTYVTDGQFRYSNNSQVHDLRLVRHTNQLQEMAAFLLGKQRDFVEAGKLLGVENKFTWYGATVDQWVSDLKVRATQIDLVNRKAKLAELESKLLRIADAEFIAELELESIKAALA